MQASQGLPFGVSDDRNLEVTVKGILCPSIFSCSYPAHFTTVIKEPNGALSLNQKAWITHGLMPKVFSFVEMYACLKHYFCQIILMYSWHTRLWDTVSWQILMTYEIVKITVRPLSTPKWQQKYLELASSNADQQLMPCFVYLQDMALPFVMVLPLLIVVSAGVYYIYNEIILFMSKSLVRNKVVVITDAVSGVGTGKWHRIQNK